MKKIIISLILFVSSAVSAEVCTIESTRYEGGYPFSTFASPFSGQVTNLDLSNLAGLKELYFDNESYVAIIFPGGLKVVQGSPDRYWAKGKIRSSQIQIEILVDNKIVTIRSFSSYAEGLTVVNQLSMVCI